MTISKILPSSNKVKSIVMLLHGYGADGEDLLDLARSWEPYLPDTLFIAPSAPEKCEQNPDGYQWFSLAQWDEEIIAQEARAAGQKFLPTVQKLLEKYDCTESELVLVGFSQGSMMGFEVAFSLPNPPAGLLSYSGAYVTGEEKNTDRTFPITMIHGEIDDVLPLDFFLRTRELLEQSKLEVDARIHKNLGHWIDPEGVRVGLEFLKRVLKS